MEIALNTKNLSYYLRGCVIVVVMINHYIQVPLSHDIRFAGGAVSIFFVLSGFGVFFSLQKALSSNDTKGRVFLKYFYKRAVRIYPLYWLSLLVMSLFYPERPLLNILRVVALRQYPAGGCGWYWFIRAILLCYLAGPVLYMLLKKLGTSKYIILVLWLTLLSSIIAFLSIPYVRRLVWQYLFLGYVLMFALGILIASLVSQNQQKYASKALTAIAMVFFIFLLCGMLSQDMLFTNSANFLAPLFLISAFALCLFFISTAQRPPLGKVLVLLGTYSYSIYLFHMPFFKIVSCLKIAKDSLSRGIVFSIVLFPVFFLVCMAMENGLKYLISGCSVLGYTKGLAKGD